MNRIPANQVGGESYGVSSRNEVSVAHVNDCSVLANSRTYDGSFVQRQISNQLAQKGVVQFACGEIVTSHTQFTFTLLVIGCFRFLLQFQPTTLLTLFSRLPSR